MPRMTTRKRATRSDKGQRRTPTPAQMAALEQATGRKLEPLQPGEAARPFQIRADAATLERLGTMTAKQRGDLIRAALGLRPGEPSESDTATP